MVDVLSNLAAIDGASAKMMVSPWTLLGAGVALFGVGWCYRLPAVAKEDARAFLWLYHRLKPVQPFFRVLWILGTLWGILGAAFATAIVADWRKSVVLLTAYSIVVLGEMYLKKTLNRPRPFSVFPDVTAAQPKRPLDSSFPSGDALRIWLIAFALMAWLPPFWGWLLLAVAMMVSVGRIALGVHHPLDVVAGTGLGMIAAALALGLSAWL